MKDLAYIQTEFEDWVKTLPFDADLSKHRDGIYAEQETVFAWVSWVEQERRKLLIENNSLIANLESKTDR